MEYNIRIFMGNEEIHGTDLKNYCIKSKTVDRIINGISEQNYTHMQFNIKKDE